MLPRKKFTRFPTENWRNQPSYHTSRALNLARGLGRRLYASLPDHVTHLKLGSICHVGGFDRHRYVTTNTAVDTLEGTNT